MLLSEDPHSASEHPVFMVVKVHVHIPKCPYDGGRTRLWVMLGGKLWRAGGFWSRLRSQSFRLEMPTHSHKPISLQQVR